MKRLTYVTVIAGGRARRTNARKFYGEGGFIGLVQGISIIFRFTEEGITWARGWHTPAAKALRVAQALI